jgi:hypothetical protein
MSRIAHPTSSRVPAFSSIVMAGFVASMLGFVALVLL